MSSSELTPDFPLARIVSKTTRSMGHWWMWMGSGCLLACGGAPAPSSVRARAEVDAGVVVPHEVSFVDGDISVTPSLIGTTCVSFAETPIAAAPPCATPAEEAKVDQLRRLGALLVLVSSSESKGPLLFTVVLNPKVHRWFPDRAAAPNRALVKGLVDGAAKDGLELALKDEKSNSTGDAHHFIFDAVVTSDSPPKHLAFSHTSVVAFLGARGLYVLTWSTNPTRAADADESATRAMASLARRTP